MTRRGPIVLVVASSIAIASATHGCTPAFRECDPIAAARLADLPARLSETGLFASTDPETLGQGVRDFTPRFPLWTDGATKRRWIRLPPGRRIDTSDPDVWVFPRGTRVWKEFTRDGVRVETRLLEKVGDDADAWTAVAYVWREDGDAYATAEGADDARGTAHDVPAAGQCLACHATGASTLLGFSAIQLPATGAAESWTLASLAEAGMIDATPAAYELPGDASTQAALGYLHANCSHCHHGERASREGARCFDPESPLDFTLRVGELASTTSTATYRTAVGTFIALGDPSSSEVMDRVASRDPWWGMPALGSEVIDAKGQRLLETWISALRPR